MENNRTVLQTAISATVNDYLMNSSEQIVKELSRGIDFNEGLEIVSTRMAHRAINISAQLSMQLVIDLLAELEIIDPQVVSTRPSLQILDGGLSKPESPEE